MTTLLILLVNVLVFIWEINSPDISVFNRIVEDFGLNWSRLLSDPWGEWPTLVTSSFLHADRFHLVSNMVFFLVFAPLVERALGSFVFLLSYLAWGILSGLAGSYFSPFTGGIGASGAVCGVMGAFFVLYPLKMPLAVPESKRLGAMLQKLFSALGRLPAFFYILLYFIGQFFWGVRSLQPIEVTGPIPLIGFWAHIGGFGAGAVWMMPFLRRQGAESPTK